MAIDFYDATLREKVSIPDAEVRKTTYEREGKDGQISMRYTLRAENGGTRLAKFVSQTEWAAFRAPFA
ncbi:MAG: hypothetical protein WBM00_09190 [Solirubrobacterales bacterium]